MCGLFCLLFVFFLQWIYLYLFIRFQRWDVSPGLLCDCATSWSLLYYPTNINIKITSTPQRLVIRGHIEGIVAFNSVWLRVPRAPRGEPLRFGISGSTLSKKQTLMRVKSSPARINKARGHRISLRGRCHVNLPDGRTAAPDLHPFCYRNLAVTRSLRYDGRLVCDLDANTHTHSHRKVTSVCNNFMICWITGWKNENKLKLFFFFNKICKRYVFFSAF